jgi:hypothetical protein
MYPLLDRSGSDSGSIEWWLKPPCDSQGGFLFGRTSEVSRLPESENLPDTLRAAAVVDVGDEKHFRRSAAAVVTYPGPSHSRAAL